MAMRDDLHRIIDDLSDADVPFIRQLLMRLQPAYTFDTAPEDDEPVTPSQRTAYDQAAQALDHGDAISHEDVLKEFGLDVAS